MSPRWRDDAATPLVDVRADSSRWRRKGAVAAVIVAVITAGCSKGVDTTATGTSSTSSAGTAPTSPVPAASGPGTTSSGASSTSVATTLSPPSSSSSSVTSAPPSSTTTTSGLVPGAVASIVAGSSGGSGEIEVDWTGVAGATGYRVSRGSSPTGPFSVSADLNLLTGDKTMAEGVTNVWSPPAGSPPFTTVPGMAPPQNFQYIEVVPDGVERRYFRVVAYSAAGEGPPSVVVCGAPPGRAPC